MPLTSKGEKIEKAMKSEYGEKKGESVFYASRNAGKISGVDKKAKDAMVTQPNAGTPMGRAEDGSWSASDAWTGRS